MHGAEEFEVVGVVSCVQPEGQVVDGEGKLLACRQQGSRNSWSSGAGFSVIRTGCSTLSLDILLRLEAVMI